MTRAHSFPQKILPNSAGQFAKFRGSPQQNRPNSAARQGLPFMSKLSFMLFRNFSFLKAGIALSYVSNMKSFFFLFKSAMKLVTHE